ncbi:hypothetical protein [Lactiplantibacillus plantarum]|uniref:hypothetical protein n=1 Tax=Lactiplantibacillus plantarum TaxID=1590 RepID=UPI00137C2862|nr:hypothetical protein [Lactiplantibacillus plantarum]MBO2709646.1 hypothetical protein [Lactiplantibacillus plantarum]MCG0568867.1 hypothetical protein [Lactiplantibacillus plantarum]MCG0615232.1 hypothetical protein [Lactiplantibacillus plantarum]MCG0653988.1 hypothetical protein [Lactiplantibacillus plantarum]MCG0710978.1 hypothetical protein [Lactiplantibacillus plantarum]
MTNSELVEQAKKLSVARDNLKMAIDYLDMVSASVNSGNKWAGRLFFADNRAGNVVENMQNVADSIMAVSNAICPED